MSLILGEHHTASAEACASLHAATGWDGTHLYWNIGRRNKMIVSHYSKGIPRYARNGEPEDYCELSETKNTVGSGVIEVTVVPAYDLGYLMRRTPVPVTLTETPDARWSASPVRNIGAGPVVASTPEDAMARICLELADAVTA